MNIIYTDRSTNGRWGVDILSGSYKINGDIYGRHDIVSPDGTVCHWPLRGVVTDLGEVDGIRVLRIEYSPDADSWLALGGELLDGGSTVVSMSMQSNRSFSAHVIGPVALIRHYGYKGRSSRTVLYRDGIEQELTPSQLLALGLLPPDSPGQPDAVRPEPVSDAMAEALRRAGLA